MFQQYGIEKTRDFSGLVGSQDKANLQLSPSGGVLAIIDTSLTATLYNTSTFTTISHNIPVGVRSIVFSPDDCFLFYSTLVTITRYNIYTMEPLIIFNATEYSIHFLRLSFDFTSLYFKSIKSHQNIYQIKLSDELSPPTLIIQNSPQCPILVFQAHPFLTSITTTSKLCQICRWDRVGTIFQLISNLNLSSYKAEGSNQIENCDTKQLVFKHGVLYLPHHNSPRIYSIDYKTLSLQTVTYVNPLTNIADSLHSYLTFIGNYAIYYQRNFNKVFIGKLPFPKGQFYPFNGEFPNGKIIFNSKQEQLYVYSYDAQQQQSSVIAATLTFNCSSLLRSDIKQKTTLTPSCQCPQEAVFNKQDAICQSPPSTPCLSPYQFNSFNQQCVLDCLQVSNSIPVSPIDEPSTCLCSSSYFWQSQTQQCLSNCSSIPHSTQINNSCSCEASYLWNSTQRKCLSRGESGVDVDNTSSSFAIGVFILLSVIIIIVYFFLYRSIKKQQKKVEKQKQQLKIKSKATEAEIDFPDTDRPFSKPDKIRLPVVESGQHLQNNDNKAQQAQGQIEDIHEHSRSFSIQDQKDINLQPEILDDEEQSPGFSQLQSDIERPLQ